MTWGDNIVYHREEGGQNWGMVKKKDKHGETDKGETREEFRCWN